MLLPIHKEIGGYMGFDLNNLNQFPYPDSKKYCSEDKGNSWNIVN